MPSYIAFLRAINLGATRKFPMSDVRAATEAAGGTGVLTHINSGNVRLESRQRSAAAVQRSLETAYEADRGFAVPTIVLTPEELVEVARVGRDLEDEFGPVGSHYVSLYDAAPSVDRAAAAEARSVEGERVVVRGRAAYALLEGNIHTSKVLVSKEFKALGTGTARTLSVLETLATKWC